MGKWKHRLSEIDEKEQTAMCAECGPGSSLRFRKSTGRWVCRKQDPRKYHNRHVARRAKLLRKYASKPDNRCAICGSEDKLRLDHCHATGFIRGVLCNSCNLALGLLGDGLGQLRKAVKYLEDAREEAETGGSDRY